MFKQHLEMIGRNETPSKKAKFWQSYVRSLKGSEDIRAHDAPRTRSYRPLSTFAELPSFRSIYDDPVAPQDRITVPGYRYCPVHRETYGYSPRPIYNRDYNHRPATVAWDPERAWAEHIERMAEIERRYPSRYGLYLKDKPNMALGPLEYEPEDKPMSLRSSSVPPQRAGSVPSNRAGSPFGDLNIPRGRSLFRDLPPLARPLRAASADRFDRILDALDVPHVYTRALSPTPVKSGIWAPRPSEVAYGYDGRRHASTFRPYNFSRMMNPSPHSPASSMVRDPWWYNLDGLRPIVLPSKSPSHLRTSYLSPIKNRYNWYNKPLRPFKPIPKMSMHYSRSPYRGVSEYRSSSLVRSSSPYREMSPVRATSVDRYTRYVSEPRISTTVRTYKIDDAPYTSTYTSPYYWSYRPYVPSSSYVRDPWWYNYYRYRPSELSSYYRYPSYYRTSYLSPVSSRYLWYSKPLRPFSYYSWL